MGQGLVGGEAEILPRMQFGDDEVVIGVEPLGHLHGRGSIGAARHGEIKLIGIGDAGKARRDGADQHRGIEHVVVKGEIIGGDDVDAGLVLEGPMAGAQCAGGGVERGGVAVALPVGFERPLELAVKADAGKAEIGGTGHGNVRCKAARRQNGRRRKKLMRRRLGFCPRSATHSETVTKARHGSGPLADPPDQREVKLNSMVGLLAHGSNRAPPSRPYGQWIAGTRLRRQLRGQPRT